MINHYYDFAMDAFSDLYIPLPKAFALLLNSDAWNSLARIKPADHSKS